MPDAVSHWQILSQDPEKTQGFLHALFGWDVSADNGLGYRMITTNAPGGIDGGLWPLPAGMTPFVQLFVDVQDIGSSLHTAERLGAVVVMPRQVLPDGDEMAIIRSPDGITFGPFTPAA